MPRRASYTASSSSAIAERGPEAEIRLGPAPELAEPTRPLGAPSASPTTSAGSARSSLSSPVRDDGELHRLADVAAARARSSNCSRKWLRRARPARRRASPPGGASRAGRAGRATRAPDRTARPAGRKPRRRTSARSCGQRRGRGRETRPATPAARRSGSTHSGGSCDRGRARRGRDDRGRRSPRGTGPLHRETGGDVEGKRVGVDDADPGATPRCRRARLAARFVATPRLHAGYLAVVTPTVRAVTRGLTARPSPDPQQLGPSCDRCHRTRRARLCRFKLSLRSQAQRGRVHAVPLAGRPGTVGEHVAEVGAAVAAHGLGPDHAVARVGLLLDRVRRRAPGRSSASRCRTRTSCPTRTAARRSTRTRRCRRRGSPSTRR